jgi:hypothetical protein
MSLRNLVCLSLIPAFLALPAAFADSPPDPMADRAKFGSLTSLKGLDSANALFLPGKTGAAGGPNTQAPPANGGVVLATNAIGPAGDAKQADAKLANPVAPRIATDPRILAIDGAGRGGTNLYGFMRDARTTTTTPAGVRMADPSIAQAIKQGNLTPAQFTKFTFK